MSRSKLMATKLCELVDTGDITNDWEETFLFDIKTKLDRNEQLTSNQIMKLEELFERY